MDPIFNFALVNTLARSLPPQLAERVELVVKVYGFDKLATAVVMCEGAHMWLVRAILAGVHLCETDPKRIEQLQVELLQRVEFGVKQGEPHRERIIVTG